MTIAQQELLKLKNPQTAQTILRFFKTNPGEYGFGDKFLGIKVPVIRNIAKKCKTTVSLNDLQTMLKNEYHEIRLCALIIMTELYKKPEYKNDILNLYLKNTKHINNWDLVDLSAPQIIGSYYIQTKDKKIIQKLAASQNLWEERIAIVSQLTAIKSGEFELFLELAKYFLTHKHDLIHKAVGWMLRETGKKDLPVLYSFLDAYYSVMPRTMLRYAIEKLSEQKRAYYMKKDKK